MGAAVGATVGAAVGAWAQAREAALRPPCLVLASGPPELVRTASKSAWRHGLAFESISFEL